MRKKYAKRPARRAAFQGIAAERLQWIDRLDRALEVQPGAPLGLVHECGQLRRDLRCFRDGFVLGARLSSIEGRK